MKHSKESQKMRWGLRWVHGISYTYAVSRRGRWDGDDSGNEWTCGYAIHVGRDGSSKGYDLYEDDGTGTGEGLGSYSTLDAAKAAAEAHDRDPYNFELLLRVNGAPK